MTQNYLVGIIRFTLELLICVKKVNNQDNLTVNFRVSFILKVFLLISTKHFLTNNLY